MKTYKHTGIYGEKEVFVFEKLEDFDEYEKLEGVENIKKYNPNFYAFKEDFIKYIGRIWENKEGLFRKVQRNTRYKVIAIEDDNAMLDWYWTVQNVNDDKDIRYILANSHDLKEGLV